MGNACCRSSVAPAEGSTPVHAVEREELTCAPVPTAPVADESSTMDKSASKVSGARGRQLSSRQRRKSTAADFRSVASRGELTSVPLVAVEPAETTPPADRNVEKGSTGSHAGVNAKVQEQSLGSSNKSEKSVVIPQLTPQATDRSFVLANFTAASTEYHRAMQERWAVFEEPNPPRRASTPSTMRSSSTPSSNSISSKRLQQRWSVAVGDNESKKQQAILLNTPRRRFTVITPQNSKPGGGPAPAVPHRGSSETTTSTLMSQSSMRTTGSFGPLGPRLPPINSFSRASTASIAIPDGVPHSIGVLSLPSPRVAQRLSLPNVSSETILDSEGHSDSAFPAAPLSAPLH